jgi:hypothetical protein
MAKHSLHLVERFFKKTNKNFVYELSCQVFQQCAVDIFLG